MQKYIVPMGVTFEAAGELQAQAMAEELRKLIREMGVMIALQGAGVRSRVQNVQPVVGPAQLDTR